jgi:hypothetical protein
LLGGALWLAVAAVPAHAEMVHTGFGRQEGQAEKGTAATAAEPDTALQVLAMVLVAPAGTQPTSSTSSSGGSNLSSVVKSPSGSGSNSNGGGSSQSGGGTTDPIPHDSPEPASLLLASLGVALTGWGQRRRRRQAA